MVRSMSLVAASWRQPLPAKSMAELGWVMVIPTLVLLLAFAVPSTRSLWEYCDDAVWDGWGAVCCGENNLWKMGYCTSDGNFTLMCTWSCPAPTSVLHPPPKPPPRITTTRALVSHVVVITG